MSVTAPETSEQTMAMRVVAALRDDIVTMALRPGDIISESDIAGRYGVSRQPVREAFIRLAQQGLLLIRPKRATVVKKISPDGVRQSRFIRESIEVEIIRRLAAQPSADAAEILTGLIDDQDKASSSGDSRRFHLLDELFHRTLARLAGVEYAWQLIDDHKMQLDRVRYLTACHRRTPRHCGGNQEGRSCGGRSGDARSSGPGRSPSDPDHFRLSRLF
jgi:DNA-binding GntR family transcriptional regulator